MGKKLEPRGGKKYLKLKSVERNIHAKIFGEDDVSLKLSARGCCIIHKY